MSGPEPAPSSFANQRLPRHAPHQISYEDVARANQRLAGAVAVTPMLRSPRLDRHLGGRLFVKAESMQHLGSFKLRGALHKVLCLEEAARARGVVAASSGNHGLAVAEAARRMGIPATIVLPDDAPRFKVDRVRAAGATVHLVARGEPQRRRVRELVRDHMATDIPPFDDPAVIAGQGSVGIELMRQCGDLQLDLDHVIVPCGGGGLTAGIAIALERLSPHTRVVAVEPEAFDGTRRSLQAGRRLTNDPRARSICDALQSGPGPTTFAINHRLIADVVVVDDSSVVAAMATARDELGIILEPSGATALAAVLSGQISTAGTTAAAIATGGNISRQRFAELVATAATERTAAATGPQQD